MKRLSAAVILVAAITALAATGCSSSSGNSPDVGPTDPTQGNGNPSTPHTAPAATAVLFQPAQGVFPFPNDLYFSGTTDGTLNIQPANALIPNQASLNALDGWSTTAPIRIRFNSPVAAGSLSAANVRVYQVTISNTTKAVTGFTRALAFGTEFSAGVATDTGVGPLILEIRPLVPLVPSTGPAGPGQPVPDGVGYLVLLLNGIQTQAGAATADTDYATIKSRLFPAGATAPQVANCASLPNVPMQGACGFTASHLAVAGATGVAPANVLVSFHFSTQATRDTLRVLGLTIFNPAAPAPAIAVNPAFNVPLNAVNPALPNIANLRVGTVTVPYYSYIPTAQAPGGISTDTATLRTPWRAAAAPPAPLTDAAGEFNLTRFNPVPLNRGPKAIPMLITVPNANAGAAGTKPAAGWPVVIFQHGITRDRSDALAIAGAFAQAGWAVVSLDLPLHGITSTTSPLYQAANEQTFNLDLVVNASGAAGPDGVIDSTGTHMINLTCPLCSRDNLRQAVVNQLALTRALPTLDLDGNAGTVDIDVTRIAFVGQSLGSITGITFGAVLPSPTVLVRSMVFSVPGGGLAELLRDSPTFGPRINAGLQAQGLLPGTTLYNQFMRDVQTAIDAGDPLNYVTQTAAQRTIYFQQMVGNAGVAPPVLPDQVIPNSATQRLITALQASGGTFPRVLAGAPRVGSGYVNFILGDHGSLLNPAAGPAATVEMQTEAVAFTVTGNTINVVNGAVVQP